MILNIVFMALNILKLDLKKMIFLEFIIELRELLQKIVENINLI